MARNVGGSERRRLGTSAITPSLEWNATVAALDRLICSDTVHNAT